MYMNIICKINQTHSHLPPPKKGKKKKKITFVGGKDCEGHFQPFSLPIKNKIIYFSN